MVDTMATMYFEIECIELLTHSVLLNGVSYHMKTVSD